MKQGEIIFPTINYMNNIDDLIDQLILILERLEPHSRKEVLARLSSRYNPDSYHVGGINIILGGNNLVCSKGVGFQNASEQLSEIFSSLPQDSLEEILRSIVVALENLHQRGN